MNEAIDRLLEALEPVAEKLGQGAEFLWRTIVNQAIVDGITFTFVGVVLFVATFILATKVVPYLIDRDGGWYGMAIAASVVAFGVGIAALSFTLDGMRHLINPEFYAVRELLDAVRR